VSLAELRRLSQIRPGLAAILGRITDGKRSGMPMRILDERVVVTVSHEVDELLGELTDESANEKTWRDLAGVFASRDEDWIVPIAYAAARVHEGAQLSQSLMKRLAEYSRVVEGLNESAWSETSPDMLTAMRAADEASDLVGFSRLVLSQVDTASPAAANLAFLLDCRDAWSNRIASIISAEGQFDAGETSVSLSERPPSPG